MHLRRYTTSALLCLAVSTPALADTSLRLQASTIGGGAELGYSFSPQFGIRGGALYGSFKLDFEGDDNNGIEGDELSYKSDVDLRNAYVLTDWHPSGKRFRVSAGILINNSSARVITRCEENSPIPGTTNCEFGNSRFSPAILGDVITNIDFEPVSPYLGIGWSRATGQGFHFSADFGVAYLGDANVKIRSTGSCNTNQQCREEVAAEQREVENELDDLNLLPIAMLALSYRF